jgi:Resolvase, N terminal domain
MIIGYARVSTDGQASEGQCAELRKAGVERVYSEKISGAISDRPALAKAIAALGSGDVLIVTKLDRLARSTRDLLNTLAAIAAAGASFKSLGDPWCDTTTPHGRLMLTVLGGTTLQASDSDGGPAVLTFRRIIVYPEGREEVEGMTILTYRSISTRNQVLSFLRPSVQLAVGAMAARRARSQAHRQQARVSRRVAFLKLP